MTEQIIEILKRNETLSGNNEFIFIPRYKYATMANEIIEAIEVMRCCVTSDSRNEQYIEADTIEREEAFNPEEEQLCDNTSCDVRELANGEKYCVNCDFQD